MDLNITATVSKSSAAKPHDIRLLKIALNRLGYYTPDADIGLADFTDAKMFMALKTFQKDRKLDTTGSIRPGDETEDALTTAIEDQPLSEKYIWRTCGDDKVRSGHAAREGKTFSWISPPEGGHPGQDHNCRCWAEPFKGYTKAQLQTPGIDAIEPVPLEDYLNVLTSGGKIIIGYAVKKFGEHTVKQSVFITYRQLERKFMKHAEDFGVTGNKTPENIEKFRKALQDHIQSSDTLLVRGTYRGKATKHLYNPKTNLNVFIKENNEFWSG